MSSFLERRFSFVAGSSFVAAFVFIIVREVTRKQPHIIASPRKTIEKLSKGEQDALPYPPTAFSGARDVSSPYGSTRVYEFGPQAGRKVLLLHGISTPSVALTSLANYFVARGCRVMLFDLWGRGYSDSPDLPHDASLYTAQIMLAIASSNLEWARDGFDVVGYSFGGGVAVEFVAGLSEGKREMVGSLVLLAPGGLIRKEHFGWESRAMFSGWVPWRALHWFVRKRLGSGDMKDKAEVSGDKERKTTGEEIRGNRDPVFEGTVIDRRRSEVTIGHVVGWQVGCHGGFVRSFVSSMRFGPTSGRQESWRRLSERGEKVLVVVAEGDSVIDGEELREDVMAVFKEEGNLEWRVVDGGHEFAVGQGEEVGQIIVEFWGLKET